MEKLRGIPVLLLILSLGSPAAAQTPAAIRLVFYDDYAPFSFVENGRLQGIYVDLVREVFEEEMGVATTLEAYPWARAQAMVKAGEADGFLTLMTPERLTYATPIEPPVLTHKLALFTGYANPYLNQVLAAATIEDLAKLHLVSYVGNGLLTSLKVKSASLVQVPRLDQILPMISFNRDFAYIESEAVMAWAVKKNGLQGRVVRGHDFGTIEVQLFLGRNSPWLSLAPKVSRAVTRILAEGRLEAIMDKYR